MADSLPLSVLAISGSLRRDSWNRKALQVAKQLTSEAGAAVTEIDLKELDLPVYDQDIQSAGMPAGVMELKRQIEGADVLLIASPENNYSISAALKNAIDWASREGNSWGGKTAILLGVSDGPYGSVRGHFQLRQILTSVNVLVLPQPNVLFRNAPEGFGPDGSLTDTKMVQRLKTLIANTLAITPAWRTIGTTKRE